MSVPISRSSSPSDASATPGDGKSDSARDQWVSQAIAAATASLRASAPNHQDAPRRAEWDFDSV